ncbi:hypothetical protein BKA62DRAFT_94944 [Auriculariales sp. MPI-PUGE-AT-0066]|nr:hypothetical protein BKA62DRAFT_94944 [Auriculariales sp. MPI-PUGE-AT-0066]
MCSLRRFIVIIYVFILAVARRQVQKWVHGGACTHARHHASCTMPPTRCTARARPVSISCDGWRIERVDSQLGHPSRLGQPKHPWILGISWHISLRNDSLLPDLLLLRTGDYQPIHHFPVSSVALATHSLVTTFFRNNALRCRALPAVARLNVTYSRAAATRLLPIASLTSLRADG